MSPVKYRIFSSNLPFSTDLENERFRDPLDFIDLIVVHIALDINGGRRLAFSRD